MNFILCEFSYYSWISPPNGMINKTKIDSLKGLNKQTSGKIDQGKERENINKLVGDWNMGNYYYQLLHRVSTKYTNEYYEQL